METVLNLIWLVVALTGVWLWRFRWARSRQNSHRWVPTECIAMVCVLALLFPVISLSDDLHPEILAVDSSSGKRSSAHLLAGSPHPHDAGQASSQHPGVAILPTGIATQILHTTASAFDLTISTAIAWSSISSGRSPPSRL